METQIKVGDKFKLTGPFVRPDIYCAQVVAIVDWLECPVITAIHLTDGSVVQRVIQWRSDGTSPRTQNKLDLSLNLS